MPPGLLLAKWMDMPLGGSPHVPFPQRLFSLAPVCSVWERISSIQADGFGSAAWNSARRLLEDVQSQVGT